MKYSDCAMLLSSPLAMWKAKYFNLFYLEEKAIPLQECFVAEFFLFFR